MKISAMIMQSQMALQWFLNRMYFYIRNEAVDFGEEKSTAYREKSTGHAENSTHGKKSQFILR